MGHGVANVYVLTMVSGLTRPSGYFDLGRSFQNVYLEVPTFASGANVFIQGSSDGTTFRRIYNSVVNSTSVQAYPWQIGSTVSQGMHPVPPGFRYYKPEVSTALTDTVTTWKMICAD